MSLPPKLATLILIDTEDYASKLKRWAQPRPLPKGVRFTNTLLFPSDIVTDGKGNILSMPLLVRRPCFGIAPAFLFHGLKDPDPSKRFMTSSTRCERCIARPACEAVVKERLAFAAQESSAEGDATLSDGLKAWDEAGGFESRGFDKALSKLKWQGRAAIEQPFSRFTFTSCNDEAVGAYWDAETERLRQKAARKTWKELQADLKQGKGLVELEQLLDRAAQERELLLVAAKTSPQPPQYMNRWPVSSLERICRVWWGLQYARLRGLKTNASVIAKCLIATGRNAGVDYDKLYQYVRKDLRRIDQLTAAQSEAATAPLWPHFEPMDYI